MSHTILVLSGGDLGLETMLIRTVLSQPSSPVEINWGQGEGWVPTQFQAAHAYGGLRQLAEMIAFEDCENSDDCVCECDNADHLPIFERARLGLVSRDVADIAEVLIGHGERFAGDDVEQESQQWIDHDFDAPEVADWCDIGCWNPSVAAQWRDAGLTPDDVKAAAESMVEGSSEPDVEWTDSCPIYSCCNGDTETEEIIEEHEYLTGKAPLYGRDGLRLYDLDPAASQLWVVAGPDGWKVEDIDPDNLPAGFRWVPDEEWQFANSRR